MTGKTTPQGTTAYSYDLENRLTNVALPDGSINSFAYDGDGKRARKTTLSGTTNYLYDGMSVIEETDQAGALIASYTTDPTALIGQIISRKDNAGQASYYSYDGIGTTRALADQLQTQVAGYSYDAFGNVLSETGTQANNYKFSTKEQDQTGLYYFGARYYDAEIGRFVTKDPLPGTLWDPQSLNQYAYCENDPVNMVDPFGLRSQNEELWPRVPAGGKIMTSGWIWKCAVCTDRPFFIGTADVYERYTYIWGPSEYPYPDVDPWATRELVSVDIEYEEKRYDTVSSALWHQVEEFVRSWWSQVQPI